MPDPMGGLSYGWPFIIGAVLGYLIGSIPFGVIISKIFSLPNPRNIGSKNIGATNVLRSGNKIAALLTLVLDGLKGALPVIIAWNLGMDMAFYVGAAAVLGHIFPIWLKFQGGKGVATSIGVILGLCWPVGIIICGIWSLVAILSRYSSLAAIIALASSPFIAWALATPPPAIWLSVFVSIIVIARHSANIYRLCIGNEAQIKIFKQKTDV